MKRWQKFALRLRSRSLSAAPLSPYRCALPRNRNDAPGRGQSVADTLEAIQKARVVTRVLFIVAHPDDEASTLLTYLPHALGTDTTLLTLNRGEGGQNAIGPEQGAQLGILRSAELSAAMNVEGPHLYFTRVVDFGFSKTLEETLEKWHGVELEDMVRVIRTVRPNIVINGWGGQKTGHGNHQDSGYQTPRAVEAAADPTKYPDQIAEGLKPWRVEMILDPVRADGPAGRKSGLHRLVGRARRRYFSDLGTQLSRHFHRRLPASPLAGRHAVSEFAVCAAPVWPEARDRRRALSVRFRAADHVARERDSRAVRGFARGSRSRARPGARGGGKTRLARRGAIASRKRANKLRRSKTR